MLSCRGSAKYHLVAANDVKKVLHLRKHCYINKAIILCYGQGAVRLVLPVLLYNNTHYAYCARKAQIVFKISSTNVKSVWEMKQKLMLWAVAQYIPPIAMCST